MLQHKAYEIREQKQPKKIRQYNNIMEHIHTYKNHTLIQPKHKQYIFVSFSSFADDQVLSLCKFCAHELKLKRTRDIKQKHKIVRYYATRTFPQTLSYSLNNFRKK